MEEMEEIKLDDNLIKEEEKIKRVYFSDYLEKKIRLYIPKIPRKIIDCLICFFILMDMSIVVIMFISLFFLLPFHIFDRIDNNIYDKCDEKNIKPEFQPFCCDHRDPIGMNCENFALGFGISALILSILYFLVLWNSKKKGKISDENEFLFYRRVPLALFIFTFFLIYMSLGSVIFFRSNFECFKEQTNAKAPENYVKPYNSIVITFSIILIYTEAFTFSLLVTIIFGIICPQKK